MSSASPENVVIFAFACIMSQEQLSPVHIDINFKYAHFSVNSLRPGDIYASVNMAIIGSGNGCHFLNHCWLSIYYSLRNTISIKFYLKCT